MIEGLAWWQSIGMWSLTILIGISAVLNLHKVSKGEHQRTETPILGATVAVINTLIVVLLLSILL